MQSWPERRVPFGNAVRPSTSPGPCNSIEKAPSFTGTGLPFSPPGETALPPLFPMGMPSWRVMVSTAPAGHAWGAGSLRTWAPGQAKLAAAATASNTLAPVEPLPFFSSACEPGAFFFMRVVPELSVTVVTGAGVSALGGAAPASASGGFHGGATSWTCVAHGVGPSRENSAGTGDANTGWLGAGGGVGTGGVGQSWPRTCTAPSTRPNTVTTTRPGMACLTRVRGVETGDAVGGSGAATG